MKNITKLALVAGASLALVSSAKAQYDNDLIIGFTTGTGNDLVYDSSVYQVSVSAGGNPLVNGQQFSLASALTAAGITSAQYSSVKWGVIGDDQSVVPTIWTTAAVTPGVIGNQQGYNAVNTGISTVGAQLNGTPTFVTPAASGSTSWNTETSSGTLTTDYKNSYVNPNAVGETTEAFYQAIDNGSTPTELGTFTFDNTGTLTFDTLAIPEPSTYGLIAGLGLLALCVRRQFSTKNA